MSLTVGVPLGPLGENSPNEFPLAGLWELLSTKPSWALDRPNTPIQAEGAGLDGHLVPSEATRAKGGAGKPPAKVPGALGEYTPPKKGDTPGWTTPKKEGFVSGKSIWRADKSTTTADVYENPDGSFTQRLRQGPVNYVGADGKLHPINSRLTRGKDGRWSVTTAPVKVILAGADPFGLETGLAATDQSYSGIADLASVSFPGGQSISYGMQSASAVAPSVSGSSATYRGLMPHTDLEMTATGTGVKGIITIQSRQAANSWVFPMQLKGLTPRMEPDGSIALLGKGGKIVATIPLGYMQDSKMQGDGDFTTSQAVKYELIKVAGKLALKVTADRAWLDDPARVYPIKVDPTAQTWDNTGDAYAHANGVDNGTSLGVGCYMASSTCDRRRSFMKFNYYDYAYGGPNNSLAGVYITGATLHLYHTWSEDCNHHSKVAAWRVAEPWFNSAGSMPNGKYPGASISDWMGDVLIDNNYPACQNGNGNRSIGQWWDMPISNLHPLREWSRDPNLNYGIALTSQDDNDRWGWKRFTSRNYDPNNGNYAPYMDITWEYNVPAQVLGQYPPSGYTSPTLTPELITEAYDPNNWPYPMQYRFLVFDPASTTPDAPVADSGFTAARNYIVPAGVMKWSKNYVWTVLVWDGSNDLSTNQGSHLISTGVPQAPITSSLSQNAEKGFAPSVGNYTTSAVDAQVPTVGPALEIGRSYNSRDPRTTEAFGAGWASALDAEATETIDPGATVARAVVVTYPTGQDVAFGRNSDGTFTAPSGRYSTFRAVSGGYELVDKDGTTFSFAVLKSAGVYGLSAIIDAQGRKLAFDYTGTRVTSLTSASGRKLNIGWTADNKHVATVSTDRADPLDAASVSTWAYTYVGDALTKVCPPTSATACHRYEYGTNSLFPTTVHDGSPHTYLRFNEAPGAGTAMSSVVDNADTATGGYHNVNLGQTGPLKNVPGVWNAPTAAGFNGTSSYVDFSQSKVAMKGSVQSVSMWFKTAVNSGVLLSYQAASLAAGTTDGNYTPVLYVGTSGKLRGKFWDSTTEAFESPNPVNDDQWHHVALVASGSGQSLYIDGQHIRTIVGAVRVINGYSTANQYVGTGFLGGLWVDQPHYNDGTNTGYPTYFNGTIGEFAFYDRALSKDQIALMASSAKVASTPLEKVIRPTGGVTADVDYDLASGAVTQVTDANNGVWKINPATIGGTSYVHTASVLSSAPRDYFRLVNANNEINGLNATTVSNVSFGGSNAGPLGETAGGFNGSSIVGSGSSIDTTQSYSVSAWVYLTEKNSNRQVLGVDGQNYSNFVFGYGHYSGDRWHMLLCDRDSTEGLGCYGPKSTSVPELNKWTHLAASVDAASRTVKLYVNGKLEGTTVVSGALWKANGPLRIGEEKWNGGFGDDWRGRLADVATYQSLLSEDAVKAQYAARDKASDAGAGVGVTAKTVTITDPGNKDTSYVYDLTAGGRQVRQIRHVGTEKHATVYGYDVGGYLRTVTDPNGNMVIEEHDVRGNAIAKTTCQNRVLERCSTVYTDYYPDATTRVLSPDPRNDVTLRVRDGRSGKLGDSTFDAFKTEYTYDTKGNVTTVTDALGRVTKLDYTGAAPATTSSPPCNANEAADKAFDRAWSGWTTKWCSLDANKWLQAELPSPHLISEIVIRHAEAGGEAVAQNTKDFDVLISADGANWTTVAQARGNTLGVTKHPLATPTMARFMKLVVITPASNGDAAARIYEIEGITPHPGLRWRTTAPSGVVDTVAYSVATGDIAETTDATGLKTRYTYDNLGRQRAKTVVAASANLTSSFTYDKLSRVKARTEPTATNRVTGAEHTPVTTTTYDDDGNIAEETTSDPTGGDAARTVKNGYNALGQIEWTENALGKRHTYSYDAYGNKISDTDPVGMRMEFTHDSAGQPLTTVLKGWTGDPNNPTAPTDLPMETRSYDPGGRLASVTDAMNWITEYKYTDDGLVALVTRRKQAVGGETFVMEENTYDLAGNLTTQLTNNRTTTTTTDYDAVNRVKLETIGGVNRTTTYQYGLDDTVTSTKVAGATGQQVIDSFYDRGGRKIAESVSTGGTAGLSGRWKLDETTGTKAADASGNNDMAVDGTVGWSTEHGGSAVFTGAGTIRSSDPVIDTSQSYTVAAWAKLTSTSGYQNVFSVAGSATDAFSLQYSTWEGKWRYTANFSDGIMVCCYAAIGTAPVLNEWTHLAVVFNAIDGSMSIYVDGALAGTGSNPTPWKATGPLVVGGSTGGSNFNGSIGDVQVYQSALPAGKIADIRAGSWPGNVVAQRMSSQLNSLGQVTSARDPNGNVTYFEYDAAGHRTVTTASAAPAEEDGGTAISTSAASKVGYNTFGEVDSSMDAKNRITMAVHDAGGQLKEIQLPPYTPPGGATVTPVSKLTYDDSGQVIESIDPTQNKTTFEYDQLGRVARRTAPGGGVTQAVYNKNGQLVRKVSPLGAESTATYDYVGRLETSTTVERYPVGSHSVQYGYNGAGHLYSVQAPGRQPTVYEHNAVGEVTKIIDPAGVPTTISYDYAGRPVESIAQDNVKRTATYDLSGQTARLHTVNAAGNTLTDSSATFDRNGNTTSIKDARGNITYFTYDTNGMLTQQVEPVSAQESIATSYGYDVMGRATRFTDGRGNKFVTTYNSFGLPESQVEPGNATFTFSYNAAGQLVRRDSPGGISVTNTYEHGRLKTSSGSGADAPTANRSYGYDLAGRVRTLAEGSATVDVSYNDRGMPLTVTGAGGSSSFTWTGDGLMETRQDAAGLSTYGYDNAGRLSTVDDPATGQRSTYAYDNVGMLGSITYGSAGNKRSFTYDGLRQLKSDTLTKPDNSPMASIGYDYDPSGNQISKVTSGFAGPSSNNYEYDRANRLTLWSDGTTSTTYGYDESGNRDQIGSRTLQYNARNQLLDDGISQYSYSPRGTLTGTTQGTVTTPSTFDAYNQQISQGTRTYTYDALGRALTGSGGLTFQYSGLGNLLAADDTATYGRDPAGGLISNKVGGAGSFAWTDMHDDLVGQFTSTGASLSASRAYSPLGKVVAGSVTGNLGYQSGWTDPATSRVNMHSRWYNPETGQFSSRDTVSVSPTPASIRANRYQYADAGPLTKTDPSGHCWSWLKGACNWGNNWVDQWNRGWNGTATEEDKNGNYPNWVPQNVREVANGAFDGAHEAANGTLQIVSEASKCNLSKIDASCKTLKDAFSKEGLKKAWDAVVANYKACKAGDKRACGKLAFDVITTATGVGGLVKAAVKIIKSAIDAIKTIATKGVKTTIAETIKAVNDKIKKVPNPFGKINDVSAGASVIAAKAAAAVAQAIQAAKAAAANATKTVKNIPVTVKNTVTRAYTGSPEIPLLKGPQASGIAAKLAADLKNLGPGKQLPIGTKFPVKALAEASEIAKNEIGVIQNLTTGQMRAIIGTEYRVKFPSPATNLKNNDAIIAHTHPTRHTEDGHFTDDKSRKSLDVEPTRVEVVVDWSGKVTHFNNGYDLPPPGSYTPLVDDQGFLIGHVS